jgi:hypothetical protein
MFPIVLSSNILSESTVYLIVYLFVTFLSGPYLFILSFTSSLILPQLQFLHWIRLSFPNLDTNEIIFTLLAFTWFTTASWRLMF